MGFDVCVVTYPDRGLGDQQVSAEYVAHAVMTMHAATGRQVDLMGHSQGASMPRWAVRFWPSVRDAIDDYVGIAGPYHGTDVAGPQQGADGVPQPEAVFQFRPGSRFVTILNDGDETPGDIDWTSLASTFDELVRPTAHGVPRPRARQPARRQRPAAGPVPGARRRPPVHRHHRPAGLRPHRRRVHPRRARRPGAAGPRPRVLGRRPARRGARPGPVAARPAVPGRRGRLPRPAPGHRRAAHEGLRPRAGR